MPWPEEHGFRILDALQKGGILEVHIRERIRRIEREGSAWLEPLEAFLNDAILAGASEMPSCKFTA